MALPATITATPWFTHRAGPNRRDAARCASLVAAIDRRADELVRRFSGFAVPDTGVQGYINGQPLTLRALISLWRQVPFTTDGECPACGSAVRTMAMAVALSRSGFSGICLGCAAAVAREVQLPGGVLRLVPQWIRDDTAVLPASEIPEDEQIGADTFTVGNVTLVLAATDEQFERYDGYLRRVEQEKWQPIVDALRLLGEEV